MENPLDKSEYLYKLLATSSPKVKLLSKTVSPVGIVPE
jgi:hypothetical protein